MKHFINAVGDTCPVPLFKAEEKLKKIGKGDVIILDTDHSCAAVNIKNEMEKRGIKVKIKEIDNGIWQVYIKKT